MTRRSQLRRGLLAAITATTLLLPISAHDASANNGPSSVPLHVCDYDWREGTWHIKQLIKCAARRWDSPGTPELAVAVARCESNLRPGAYNSGGYAGVFQQSTRYWPERADRWGQPDRSVYNGRANIIVSIRMAAAAGSWSAWAGCG
jgi:hypothetical protein